MNAEGARGAAARGGNASGVDRPPFPVGAYSLPLRARLALRIETIIRAASSMLPVIRIRMPRWTAAIVFVALALGHALVLPPFEGMDEPAHFSSILQFATGEGRPVPGRARLHRSIERAV